jgi:dipeptidyl aminopeptidase/acylaminoacyl peptidase
VIRTLDVGSFGVYFIGGSTAQPLSLVFLDLKTVGYEVISCSSNVPENLKPYISIPQEVFTYSSLDRRKVFGFFYSPKNPDDDSSTLPPLIIKCHSGPTSYAQGLLSWDVQFWTSRGFAFLDVNYRGSLGFGRAYQEALNYNWGVLDVQDCLDLALSLAKEQLVDPNALFAKGSSSGGFTALSIAAAFSELKGCISYYGVTDLFLLAHQTHKFEKHYLDSLIGNYKEFKTRYKARSPSERAVDISCPVLFLHGNQDFVVPLSQAELLHKKLPSSALIVLQGEGHGFRRADTIKACLEAEESFYKKILSSLGKKS